MNNSCSSSRASDHFNLIRGLAALAVLLYHVRYRFYFDYSDLEAPTSFDRVFYAATAFGHDAVIIFFVLSGYFISRSVTSSIREGRWSWRVYFTNRLTRLYLVLVPGLALTCLWDQIGLAFFESHPIYTGELRSWKHDFFGVAQRLMPETLLGNALFLQSIRCPPYGSNDPLWSLSYEFWYYVSFPAGIICLAGPGFGWLKRLLAGLLLAGAIMIMSRSMLMYMPIWLGGAVVAHIPPVTTARRRGAGLWIALAGLAFFILIGACHLGTVRDLLSDSTVIVDYVTGFSFMGLLWVVAQDRIPSRAGIYASLSRGLSDISYTLYVVHMPFLVIVRAALLPDAPWAPGPSTMAWFLALVAVSLVYAWLIALLTERQTGRFRQWITSLVGCAAAQSAGSVYTRQSTASFGTSKMSVNERV